MNKWILKQNVLQRFVSLASHRFAARRTTFAVGGLRPCFFAEPFTKCATAFFDRDLACLGREETFRTCADLIWNPFFGPRIARGSCRDASGERCSPPWAEKRARSSGLQWIGRSRAHICTPILSQPPPPYSFKEGIIRIPNPPTAPHTPLPGSAD